MTTGKHLDSKRMADERAALERRLDSGDLRHVVEHHGHDAARRVVAHTYQQSRDLGLGHADIYRAVAEEMFITPAIARDLLKTTHVIVGDHPPEPRVDHSDDSGECLIEPGTRASKCGGVACRSHKRCCWQS